MLRMEARSIDRLMRKRGWNDEASSGFQQQKELAGLSDRADLVMFFDLLTRRKVRECDPYRREGRYIYPRVHPFSGLNGSQQPVDSARGFLCFPFA